MGGTTNKETHSSARPVIRRKEQTDRLRKKEKQKLRETKDFYNMIFDGNIPEPIMQGLGDVGKW